MHNPTKNETTDPQQAELVRLFTKIAHTPFADQVKRMSDAVVAKAWIALLNLRESGK